MRIPRDAYRVYLLAAGARAFLLEFGFSASGVYQIVNVGMTPLQLILVGTVLSATIFLFEIPTGIVADVYSRRLSVLIGTALAGIGFISVGLSPTFAAVLFSNFLWGVSHTFISGAFAAWLVDEVGQQRAEQGFMRRTQVEQLARVIGLLLGAGIGSFVIAMPMLLSGAGLLLLSLYLLVVMPETGFVPASRETRNPWAALYTTFQAGASSVRGHTVLMPLTLVFVVRGAALVGFYRLWEKHLLDHYTLPALPVPNPAIIWFSLLPLFTGLIAVVVSEMIRTRIAALQDRGIAGLLMGLTTILILALAGFGLAPELALAVLFYLVAFALGDVTVPIFEVWTNRHVRSEVRATVLSLYGQASAIGEVTGGPVVGALGNTSTCLAMLLSAGLLVPTLLLYGWLARRRTSTVATPSQGC